MAVFGLDCLAAYLNATQPTTNEDFIDFVEAAGITSPIGESTCLAGLPGRPVKDLRWRLSSYQVPNVLRSAHADAD